MSVHLRYSADLSEPADARAHEIRELIEKSGVLEEKFAIPAPSAPVPDVVSYRLKIEDGPRRVSLTCTEATAPPGLMALLSHLRGLALERRGAKGG